MRLSKSDIKRYRRTVKIQSACEMATISAFAVISVYILDYLEADLAMTMVGVELYALNI